MPDTTVDASARRSWRKPVTPSRVYAVTRIALGAWLFSDPAGFGAKWFTGGQDPLLTGSIIRSVGARDLGIGLGLLLTEKPRTWLLLCAFCDIVDASMVLLARSRFTTQQTITGVAGAISYALVAIIIAVIDARRTTSAARTAASAS